MADVPALGGNTNKTPQAVRRELRMESGAGASEKDVPGPRSSPSKGEMITSTMKTEIKVAELQFKLLEDINGTANLILERAETTERLKEIIRTCLDGTNVSTEQKRKLQGDIEDHTRVLFESATMGSKLSITDAFQKVSAHFADITATIKSADIDETDTTTDEESLAHRSGSRRHQAVGA